MWGITFPEWLLSAANFIVINGARMMIHSTVILSIGLILAYAVKRKGASVQSVILRMFLIGTFLWIFLSPYMNSERFRKVIIEIPKVITPQEKESFYDVSLIVKETPDNVGHQHYSVQNKIESSKNNLNNNNEITNANIVTETLPRQELIFNYSSYKGYVSKNNEIRAIHYLIISLIWLIVSLFFGIRLIISLFSAGYFKKNSLPAEEQIYEKCATIAISLGLKPPSVLRSSLINSPLIAGIFKPAIFLPSGKNYIGGTADNVFLHELSHIKRKDNFWNAARNLALSILPFQPMLWILSGWMENTADYSCDDFVIKHTSDRHSYADGLFGLAVNYNPAWQEKVAGAGLISIKSQLYKRIKRILDKQRIIRLETGKRFMAIISAICVISIFSACIFTVREKAFAVMNGKILLPVFNYVNNNTTAYTLMKDAENFLKPIKILRQTENQNVRETSEDTGIYPVVSSYNVPTGETLLSNSFMDENENSTITSGSFLNTKADYSTATADFNHDEGKVSISNVLSEKIISSETKGGNQQKLSTEKPVFIGNSSLSTTGYKEKKIRMPVAKAVNVEIDFDYDNFDFDLNNQDDSRLYNLYRSLDKEKNEPAWSPDGKWIVFTDHSRIWIVSSNGGEPKLIFEETNKGFSVGNFESICFTPDSKEVTFKKDVYDEKRGSIIEIMGYSDISQYAVFSNPIPCIESVNIETLGHRIIVDEGYRCTWSHNGRYLCYLNWTSQTGPDASLYGIPVIYDTKAGVSRFLVSDYTKRYGSPSFSPDDKYVVIPVRDGSGPIELYKIPLDGGQPEQFTKYFENDTYGKYLNFPEYSPDGKWILFTDFTWCDDKPDKRLFVYNTSTRNVYEVFPKAYYPNSYGRWSPDGAKICYLSEEKDGNYIYSCDFFPESLSKPVNTETTKPIIFSLKGNYPNPFNTSTTIAYSIPETGNVVLEIFNVSGQRVKEIVNCNLTSGSHNAVWDGCDSRGNRAASGIYISRIRYNNRFLTSRMTLLK